MDWKTLRDFLGQGRTCAHYSAIAHGTDFISTHVDATVKGAVCTLVTEFKSVTRVQRRVRTEWNVDPPTSKSIHQWDRTLKETGTLVSQTGKYLSVIEDTVDCVRDLFCRSPDKFTRQASNDLPFCSNTSLYTRD
ncbi:uncharacterized protein TNCV_1376441 [Trichonephila clavipes]|nr:uncharacterized protein TNCV_1376441 [Trichonephila clavipes]